MKVSFTKKKLIALGIMVLLIVACAFLVRTLYIAPAIQAKERSYSNLEVEKQQLELLNVQLRGGTKTPYFSSISLQEKVPVNSLLDQFLLDLSRAETLSNTYISNISLQDIEITNFSDFIGTSSNQDDDESSETDTNTEEEVENEAVDVNFDGLRKITADVNISAVNYYSLYKFLHVIDSLPRIVNIESINFSDDTGELIGIDQDILELHFNVKISTYYQPTLDELKGDNPTFDYNRPGNKDNPLYDN